MWLLSSLKTASQSACWNQALWNCDSQGNFKRGLRIQAFGNDQWMWWVFFFSEVLFLTGLAICTFVSAMSSFLVYLQRSCIFHHKDIWCSRALLARESSDFLSLLPCNHNLDIWIWFPCACCWCAILALLLFEILNRTPHNEKTSLDVWFLLKHTCARSYFVIAIIALFHITVNISHVIT